MFETTTASTHDLQATPATAAKSATHRRKTRPATFVDLIQLFKQAGIQPSKKALRELLQSRGLRADAETVDSYFGMPALIRDARRTRINRRFHARFGRDPVACVYFPRTHRFGPLPQGTPAQRLAAVRKSAVQKCAKSCFRHGAAGGSSFMVGFADASSQVKYGKRTVIPPLRFTT